VIDAMILALLLGAMTLLCAYHLRRRRIAEFARGATQNRRTQREAAFALARSIFVDVKRGSDPVFLSRFLNILGASPVAVLEKGGCCSGIHRLFITSLDTIGIRAAQITVLRAALPKAAHCLAQVIADGENILIDADYGVWFRRVDGRAVDLFSLRSGLTPVIERFVIDAEATDTNGPRSAGYPNGEYYRFDYDLSRTANWAQTRTRRALYPLLRRVTADHIDCLLVPPILEWPEIVLAAGLCAAALGLVVARALVV
jgi:hypothetical protein